MRTNDGGNGGNKPKPVAAPSGKDGLQPKGSGVFRKTVAAPSGKDGLQAKSQAEQVAKQKNLNALKAWSNSGAKQSTATTAAAEKNLSYNNSRFDQFMDDFTKKTKASKVGPEDFLPQSKGSQGGSSGGVLTISHRSTASATPAKPSLTQEQKQRLVTLNTKAEKAQKAANKFEKQSAALYGQMQNTTDPNQITTLMSQLAQTKEKQAAKALKATRLEQKGDRLGAKFANHVGLGNGRVYGVNNENKVVAMKPRAQAHALATSPNAKQPAGSVNVSSLPLRQRVATFQTRVENRQAKSQALSEQASALQAQMAATTDPSQQQALAGQYMAVLNQKSKVDTNLAKAQRNLNKATKQQAKVVANGGGGAGQSMGAAVALPLAAQANGAKPAHNGNRANNRPAQQNNKPKQMGGGGGQATGAAVALPAAAQIPNQPAAANPQAPSKPAVARPHARNNGGGNRQVRAAGMAVPAPAPAAPAPVATPLADMQFDQPISGAWGGEVQEAPAALPVAPQVIAPAQPAPQQHRPNAGANRPRPQQRPQMGGGGGGGAGSALPANHVQIASLGNGGGARAGGARGGGAGRIKR